MQRNTRTLHEFHSHLSVHKLCYQKIVVLVNAGTVIDTVVTFVAVYRSTMSPLSGFARVSFVQQSERQRVATAVFSRAASIMLPGRILQLAYSDEGRDRFSIARPITPDRPLNVQSACRVRQLPSSSTHS